MTKKPNIILITIDALRADHLGFRGYQKNISPNLDRLAEESAAFSQAFAVGPNTPCSFPAILTSTYPFDYQGPQKIEKPRVLISQVLKEAGYITAAFHPNPFLAEFFGYNQGWDFFEYISTPVNPAAGPSQPNNIKKIKLIIEDYLRLLARVIFSIFPELFFRTRYLMYKLGFIKMVNKIRAAFLNRVVKNFIQSVKDKEKPFFVWIHYIDVHDPYLPYDYYLKERPLSYSESIGKGAPFFLKKDYVYNKSFKKTVRRHLENIIDLYDQGIKYVDEQLGELLDFFKKENIYQNSIICLTADHGDEFLEHGGSSHSPRLYNELLRVPLLIKFPGSQKKVVDKKVSLIDLAPTICDLAGVKPPSSFKGQNLFEGSARLIFHQIVSSLGCKVACQSNHWKYILNSPGLTEELYNSFQDPKEQNNLAEFQPEIISQMRQKIEEFEKENPPFLSQPAR